MRRVPHWICLAAALLLAAFTGAPPRKEPGPGTALADKDRLSLLGHWFDRPYRYMFDRANPRLTLGQSAYGEFQAGIDGIIKYGGLARAAAAHLGLKRPSFGDLRPLQRLSGLPVYRSRTRDGRSPSRFNPAIVRWGYLNLIPAPDDRVLGHRCQEIYDRIFSRFFRLMAASYLHLDRGRLWKREIRAYRQAMKRRRFDGVDYLQRRYAGVLPGYDLPRDGTRFTAPMSVGFWLRRRMDGTASELWTGLGLLLQRFDRSYWGGLKQTASGSHAAP